MNHPKQFLFDVVSRADLIRAKITSAPEPQKLRCIVDQVYSARFGISKKDAGQEIEFVQGHGGWGNAVLEVGDYALIFLRRLHSGVLYEEYQRGHFLIENLDGTECAIYQGREILEHENFPTTLRENLVDYTLREYAIAIRFSVLESYLQTMINEVGEQELQA